MSLPDEVFKANMLGQSGPEMQLHAFRACWDRGETYVRAVRQAAIGCAMKCSGSEVQAELEALCLMLYDVTVWFERCGQEYTELEKSVTKKVEDKLIH